MNTQESFIKMKFCPNTHTHLVLGEYVGNNLCPKCGENAYLQHGGGYSHYENVVGTIIKNSDITLFIPKNDGEIGTYELESGFDANFEYYIIEHIPNISKEKDYEFKKRQDLYG